MIASEHRRHTVALTTVAVAVLLLLCSSVDGAVAVHVALDDIKDSLFATAPGIADIGNSSVVDRYPSTGPAGCIWLVLYYDSTCGHCRNFAPKFAQLSAWMDSTRKLVASSPDTPLSATTAAALPSVVVVAINCAQFSSDCVANKVADVPTLRLHYADRDEEDGVRRVDINVDEDTNTSYSMTGGGECWGLQAGFSKCGWVSAVESALTAAYGLLQGSMSAHLDQQVCIAVGAFLCSSKHLLLQKHAGDARRAPMTPSEMVVFKRDVSNTHRQDVAGALMYSLWHEVPMAPRTPSQAQALAHFLSNVCTTFPWLNCKPLLAHTRLTSTSGWRRAVLACKIPFRLSSKPTSILPSSSKNGGGVPPNRVDIDVDSPLTSLDIEWRSCRGSSPEYRGFTCGLWMLYHGLTVHSSEPLQALSAIQSYVRHFFLCQECRVHFAGIRFTATEHAAYQLWRAHNEVNVRLQGEPSDDPLVPKGIFPQQPSFSVASPPKVVIAYLTVFYSPLGGGSLLVGGGNDRNVREAMPIRQEQEKELERVVVDSGGGDGSVAATLHEVPIGLRRSTVFISAAAVVVFVGLGIMIGSRVEGINPRYGGAGGSKISQQPATRSATFVGPPLRSLV